MLVLSRKAGEQVSIGSDIEVVVLGITKGRVRLGFACPPEIPVHREEIRVSIERERTCKGFVPSC